MHEMKQLKAQAKFLFRSIFNLRESGHLCWEQSHTPGCSQVTWRCLGEKVRGAPRLERKQVQHGATTINESAKSSS